MESKKCSKCGRVLPIAEFPANKISKDGHYNLCRTCLHAAKAKPLPAAMLPLDPDRPLAQFKPRELMAELHARGYEGELTFVQTINLSSL